MVTTTSLPGIRQGMEIGTEPYVPFGGKEKEQRATSQGELIVHQSQDKPL